MKKFLVSLILLLSLVQLGQAVSKLSALRQSLFLGYDKLVKPDDPVKVHFGVNLLNLDICPHKQVWHLYNSSYFNSICYYCLEMYILSFWTYLDDQKPLHNTGNAHSFITVRGSITVPSTSCKTGLDMAVVDIKKLFVLSG